MPIYLGPVIAAPLWIVVLRKIIRISKQHKISSIADFISLRYGNNRLLGALITIVCCIAILPYLSLQLKAISESFEIITDNSSYISSNIWDDSTFYIAVLLAVFATFFGTQDTDASEKHRGIVATVAMESIIKLLFFLIVGVYITFVLFDGPQDILSKFSTIESIEAYTTISGLEGGINWFFMIALSFFAIFLLPRQFQLSVIENSREKFLKKAIWLFPLYLLIFNLFIVFVAFGGKVLLGDEVNSEYYSILLPLAKGNVFLALLVFLGGLSAVISMVVVSTLALSTMVSNNLIIPYGFIDKFIQNRPEKNALYIKNIRRISIFSIIILAYVFYYNFSIQSTLISIGLLSFVIVAQLAPSFFLGLYWNRGSARASIAGIVIGVLTTGYTLILPFTIYAVTGSNDFVEQGILGLSFLKPYQLFGIDFLNPYAHATFWSLSLNTFSYLILSLVYKGNYRERNYAEMFIDSEKYTTLQDNALVWKGEAYVDDIKNILEKLLGEKETRKALNVFFTKYNLPSNTKKADARLINFSEKLLTGTIGNASAKILISSVVKEEELSLVEVLKILEESKETIARNNILREKSKALTNLTKQLKAANQELLDKDRQKDEFLDTIAHELKTPITGIRASAELVLEDKDMPENLKKQFLGNILNDSDRLSRLINSILDFEKMSKGKTTLNFTPNDIQEVIEKSIQGVSHLATQKNIKILNENSRTFILEFDFDRILQVLTNLLSNAIKFSPEYSIITINYKQTKDYIELSVSDNGKGIPKEDTYYIFDKFYQSKNQNIKKQEGSGLGLAISKQIIEQHQGEIWIDENYKNGAKLVFKLPFK